MKKLLSCIVLATSMAFSSFANAETFTEGDKEIIASKGWKELGSNETYEFYANPSLVYKLESHTYSVPVQARILQSRDEGINVGDIILRYDVYSCTKYKTATLRQVLYTKTKVYKDAANAEKLEWHDANPDSYQGYILQILCDPKKV